MNHQELVSKASTEYREAKKQAKSRAKQEGLKAYKAAYYAVYDQEMEKASINYGRALRKKVKYAEKEVSPSVLAAVEDMTNSWTEEDNDTTDNLSNLSSLAYPELMKLYQDGKITAEQAQEAVSKQAQ